MVQKLNIGYMWMLVNCMASAAYVSHPLLSLSALALTLPAQVLAMRKRIKVTGFSDWETMFYNNVLSIPVLAVLSILVEDWSLENRSRNLSALLPYHLNCSFYGHTAQPKPVPSFYLPSHFLAQPLLVFHTQLRGVFGRPVAQRTGA
jgi:hypothetical protein